MRVSHSSSCAAGLAFMAGKVPATPALQVSMTSSGPDTRNIGAAIAGTLKRPRRLAGRLMGLSP